MPNNTIKMQLKISCFAFDEEIRLQQMWAFFFSEFTVAYQKLRSNYTRNGSNTPHTHLWGGTNWVSNYSYIFDNPIRNIVLCCFIWSLVRKVAMFLNSARIVISAWMLAISAKPWQHSTRVGFWSSVNAWMI